ncbi:MAG: hypothetical protein LBJ18_00555 [Rickettsiales bacterium]|jgi:hypothetical protein|nr:hypothetical protein [Rickettsiales bacterium]
MANTNLGFKRANIQLKNTIPEKGTKENPYNASDVARIVKGRPGKSASEFGKGAKVVKAVGARNAENKSFDIMRELTARGVQQAA